MASGLGPDGAYIRGAGGSVTLVLDMRPVIRKITSTMNKFSEATQAWALSRALNKVGGVLRTAVRRDVANETGARYGHVSKVITSVPAAAGRLYYKIKASDKAMPLIAFASTQRLGAKNVKANPWNHARSFKGTFIVPMKSGPQVVKRILHGPGSRKRGAGLKDIKILWGPIIPKEMIRPGNPSTETIARSVPDRLIPEVIRQLGLAAGAGRS